MPILRAVVRATGVRLVYATGWAERVAADDWAEVLVTAGAPHDWLFPRVLGAIHHGGAGTTAAAVTAGIPSLIAWFIVDQVFWARRIAELGAGIDVGSFAELNAETLVAAVRRLLADRALAESARGLAGQVAQEDGIARAVRTIERHLRENRSGGPIAPPGY